MIVRLWDEINPYWQLVTGVVVFLTALGVYMGRLEASQSMVVQHAAEIQELKDRAGHIDVVVERLDNVITRLERIEKKM